MKRIFIEGKFYRFRRGKLVEIPTKWVGQIPTKRTIRNRQPIKRRTRKNKNKST